MTHQAIKDLFFSSIKTVTKNISQYSLHPNTDFQRKRMIPPEKLIAFLVSQGSSSTKVEMLGFWEWNLPIPTPSALNQQRTKLKPEALEAVFKQFNSDINNLSSPVSQDDKYRFLAADGSTFTYFSTPSFSSNDYYCSPGNSIRGVYSMHLNALYDLTMHTYTDAIIQPIHSKNEFSAFCDMVDRNSDIQERRNVYIGDRGYCSYNNMAHVIENNQYFLFRTKDIHSKGLVANFDFPEEECFDIWVNVALTRSHSRKVSAGSENYVRFIDKASSFDFIEYGSYNTYQCSFRIVRFPLGDSNYECVVTNLPENEFSAERIKELYYCRWGIESSFRKLKYTIGLSNFHSYKPQYIEQEIWAKLIAYNITETMINHTILKKRNTKHDYKVNFMSAAYVCRVFIRPNTKNDESDVMLLLQKELIPIRKGRTYPRLQTAHFRRPRYFIYRAA